MSCEEETKNQCQQVIRALKETQQKIHQLEQRIREEKAIQLKYYTLLCSQEETLKNGITNLELRQVQNIRVLYEIKNIGLWQAKHTDYLIKLNTNWEIATTKQKNLLLEVIQTNERDHKEIKEVFFPDDDLFLWRYDTTTFPMIKTWFQSLSDSKSISIGLRAFFNVLVVQECEGEQFLVEMAHNTIKKLESHLQLFQQIQQVLPNNMDQSLLQIFPDFHFESLPSNTDLSEIQLMHSTVRELKLEDAIKSLSPDKTVPFEWTKKIFDILSHHSGFSGSVTLDNLRSLYRFGWLNFVKRELHYIGVLIF